MFPRPFRYKTLVENQGWGSTEWLASSLVRTPGEGRFSGRENQWPGLRKADGEGFSAECFRLNVCWHFIYPWNSVWEDMPLSSSQEAPKSSVQGLSPLPAALLGSVTDGNIYLCDLSSFRLLPDSWFPISNPLGVHKPLSLFFIRRSVREQ